ncbi:glycosyltransferase family 4 protein [Oceanirhabdus sp. W0125-5]|uniref:glycosyltransferase family 4 protein n=1 Tax=Oceanirhabdus sp. W0125-5 TaxID=2999116 RepID=UPI0022F2D960|nr:glycosyltransferase family 4 protein [Oceanirhabdus sp. W0125-5]WBW99439.1 glycosyltransferase family 4 protein [Oceanirhabdus sp. W0125-5]
MKICFLADAGSSHTIKWCDFFKKIGYEVHVISFNYGEIVGVKVHTLGIDKKDINVDTSLKKIRYITKLFEIKKIIKKISPDILHAHYASSYGLIGALTSFHPYILSVWGSDVYLFPKKGKIFKKILEFNLKNADIIFSTSKHMAVETNKYSKKSIVLTPFGIDVQKFKPYEVKKSDEKIRICIIKSLEKVYGIDLAIKAFSELCERYDDLELIIGGDGTQKEALIKLADELGHGEKINFLGKLNWKEIVDVYNSCHFGVFPSMSESFGVSALEAQACGIPVIVSDVGGFPEVVDNNNSGFIFEKGNLDELKKLMEKLINSKQLRDSMGIRGREFVLSNYKEEDCFKEVINIYDEIIK